MHQPLRLGSWEYFLAIFIRILWKILIILINSQNASNLSNFWNILFLIFTWMSYLVPSVPNFTPNIVYNENRLFSQKYDNHIAIWVFLNPKLMHLSGNCRVYNAHCYNDMWRYHGKTNNTIQVISHEHWLCMIISNNLHMCRVFLCA